MAARRGNLPFIARFISQLGYDEAVDLICALEDAVDARVAVDALGWVILHVAVSGHDLDQFVSDVIKHFRAKDFEDGALDSILFDALLDLARLVRSLRIECIQSRVHHPRSAVGHALGHIQPSGDGGDLALDEAELRDGFAEGDSFFGVPDAKLHALTAAADAGRAELESAHVQNVEGDMVAFRPLHRADFRQEFDNRRRRGRR